MYWLEVNDKNGCIGKDTLIVNAKQCMEGFYIPDAFTPNGDGKNDTFKPLLLGNVASYRFTIYNRWGAKVFESNEVGKGWDGKVQALATDTNVFVWICQYQLLGQSLKTEKGTVVVVR